MTTPDVSKSLTRSVEVDFENFPITIAEVRAEYQKIMSGAVATKSVEQPQWP